MVAAVTLSMLVRACAPAVAARTTLAIISVESGGDPWAIGDNTAKRAYHPKTMAAAQVLAANLLQQGHNLDLGLMQVNSSNLKSYGMTTDTIFDPCTNTAVGSTILTHSYAAASAVYGPGQTALFHAFSIYNSGRANASLRYARIVWNTGLDLKHP